MYSPFTKPISFKKKQVMGLEGEPKFLCFCNKKIRKFSVFRAPKNVFFLFYSTILYSLQWKMFIGTIDKNNPYLIPKNIYFGREVSLIFWHSSVLKYV